MCEFFTDMLILGLIMLMMSTGMKGGSTQCGIPIRMWLNVFFGVFGVRSASNLLKIWVIRHFYESVVVFDVLKLLFIDGFLIGWLVYGNQIYYSRQNNCNANPSTQFLDEFMSCILFIGYLLMAMYGLILVTLPCLFIYIRMQQSNDHSDGPSGRVSQRQVPKIISSLSRVNFDPEKFKHENQCAICLVDYDENDVIT
jgi:hypothetical protein